MEQGVLLLVFSAAEVLLVLLDGNVLAVVLVGDVLPGVLPMWLLPWQHLMLCRSLCSLLLLLPKP
jgi:hypothetical protein